jgi:hypothetical protein
MKTLLLHVTEVTFDFDDEDFTLKERQSVVDSVVGNTYEVEVETDDDAEIADALTDAEIADALVEEVLIGLGDCDYIYEQVFGIIEDEITDALKQTKS